MNLRNYVACKHLLYKKTNSGIENFATLLDKSFRCECANHLTRISIVCDIILVILSPVDMARRIFTHNRVIFITMDSSMAYFLVMFCHLLSFLCTFQIGLFLSTFLCLQFFNFSCILIFESFQFFVSSVLLKLLISLLSVRLLTTTVSSLSGSIHNFNNYKDFKKIFKIR